MIIGLPCGAAGAFLPATLGGDSSVVTMICTMPFGLAALAMQAMTALAMALYGWPSKNA